MSMGQSLAGFFRTLWRGADGVRKVLHLLFLLIVFVVFVGVLSSTAPNVPASAALVIAPSGTLVEQLEGDPFDRALAELLGEAEPQTLVKNILDGLAYAKDDDRIKVVVLDLSAMPGGGMSKLKRIGEAIEDFKTSGKPVIAHADYFGQGSYYLASRADEVYMHPHGALFLSGLGIFLNYYKDALDTLLVDWNVFRVGKYKSAVEPYMRNDMSPEEREALSAVIDQLWLGYSTDIEAARKLEPGTIAGLLDNLVAETRAVEGDLAMLALRHGFVDALLSREELLQRIIAITGENGDESAYPAASLSSYLAQMRIVKGDVIGDNNIAVVVASGEILNGSQAPGTIGGDSTARLLRDARNDDSVKAVVLRVDSPGGSSFASEVIRNEVDELKEAGKPVVVSMSSLAASGGYWISMAADRIYASRYTITGSIGIFGMFPTIHRSLDAIGISSDGVGTTPWSDQLRIDRPMSDGTREMFQLGLEKGYRDFITGVAEHREMSVDVVNDIAQGRIWTGDDALRLGLVDTLGDLEDAVETAAELAGIEGEDYGRKYFEKRLSPGEQLAIDLLSSIKSAGVDPGSLSQPRPALDKAAAVLDSMLSSITRFNDPRGMYAHCLCAFDL